MGLLRDLSFVVRDFRRRPAYPLAAFLLLAVTIGANTVVFSCVKSILLQPLDMLHPDELVALESLRPDGTTYPFSIPFFLELRSRAAPFADIAAHGGMNANFASDAQPERILGVRASGNYFSMFGVSPQLGRLLQPEDDLPAAPRVIVVSGELWRRRFGGSSEAIGKSIRLNGEPYTLIGVLPDSFQFKTQGQEFAIPLAALEDPWRDKWNSTSFLRLYARMKPNITTRQASAGLAPLLRALRSEHPQEMDLVTGIDITPLREHFTGDSKTMLTTLMAAVLLVLLIACANISCLALTRFGERTRDLSLRMALGASPWSILRYVLLENIVLFCAGGLGGILLSFWAIRVALTWLPAGLPRLHEGHPDWIVAATAFSTSLLCGLVSGLIPAVKAYSQDLQQQLRSGGRSAAGSRGATTLRSILVIGETALSVVLLAGAGLLLLSFLRIRGIDPGFKTEHLTTFRLALPPARYKNIESISNFHDRLLDEAKRIPGVQSAGCVSILPLSGPMASADFTIKGAPPSTTKEKPSANYRMAGDGYFQTMGIPILRGRGLLAGDTASSKLVAVVSQSLVSRYFSKPTDGVGATLLMEDNGGAPRELEIVGVVGNTREASLEENPVPMVYVAIPQIGRPAVRFLANNMFWVVRVSGSIDPANAMRTAIGRLDGDIALASSAMDQYVSRATASRAFVLRFLGAFAIAALLLAAGGLYALIAFTIAQRAREFGIRIALGASRPEVAAIVLRQGLSLALAGVCVGTFAALALSRYIAKLLFEVGSHNLAAMAAPGLLLLAAAACASVVPMRRAFRSDPIQCLRSE